MRKYPVDPETGLEYEPLPEEKAAARVAFCSQIHKMRLRGLTVHQIAEQTSRQERTIYRILKETDAILGS